MGVPMNYGLCQGGPWDKKNLAHHEPVYLVPRDIHSKKIVIGVRPGTKGYTFGQYLWKDKVWLWVDSE